MALATVRDAGTNIDGISRLPIVRQFGFMIGLAATIAVGMALYSWVQQPNYGMLYSGLSEKDSAGVVDVLQKARIPFQLGAQGTVLIPAEKVHDMRLKLAAQGLPKGSAVGFESLNEGQGFGVSQFMENARYQRALEVELSRSIGTLANVESARVHLAIPKRSVFLRDRQKPSASVVLSLGNGRSLEDEQVAAIMHLVSAGIPDMDSNQVTIVDQRGRLLTAKHQNSEFAVSSAQFEQTQKLEKTYALRIEELLSPIVGKESVRAQVSTELDFTSNETTEETFNPDKPVVRSEQLVQERMSNGADSGIPGALSNQPPGTATAPETTAKKTEAGVKETAAATPVNSKQRTVKNYEVDRTISHTRLGSGAVKRVSVAVVIDDKITSGSGGALIRTPYSPEDIERFTSLVKEAVGYNEKRGDSVSVINTPFSVPPKVEPLPEVPLWKQPDVWDKAKIGFGWALMAILVFGVLRMMGQIAKGIREARPVVAVPMSPSGEALPPPTPQPTITVKPPVNVNLDAVKGMAKQDPKLVAQVVKGWVAADG